MLNVLISVGILLEGLLRSLLLWSLLVTVPKSRKDPAPAMSRHLCFPKPHLSQGSCQQPLLFPLWWPSPGQCIDPDPCTLSTYIHRRMEGGCCDFRPTDLHLIPILQPFVTPGPPLTSLLTGPLSVSLHLSDGPAVKLWPQKGRRICRLSPQHVQSLCWQLSGRFYVASTEREAAKSREGCTQPRRGQWR